MQMKDWTVHSSCLQHQRRNIIANYSKKYLAAKQDFFHSCVLIHILAFERWKENPRCQRNSNKCNIWSTDLFLFRKSWHMLQIVTWKTFGFSTDDKVRRVSFYRRRERGRKIKKRNNVHAKLGCHCHKPSARNLWSLKATITQQQISHHCWLWCWLWLLAMTAEYPEIYEKS